MAAERSADAVHDREPCVAARVAPCLALTTTYLADPAEDSQSWLAAVPINVPPAPPLRAVMHRAGRLARVAAGPANAPDDIQVLVAATVALVDVGRVARRLASLAALDAQPAANLQDPITPVAGARRVVLAATLEARARRGTTGIETALEVIAHAARHGLLGVGRAARRPGSAGAGHAAVRGLVAGSARAHVLD